MARREPHHVCPSSLRWTWGPPTDATTPCGRVAGRWTLAPSFRLRASMDACCCRGLAIHCSREGLLCFSFIHPSVSFVLSLPISHLPSPLSHLPSPIHLPSLPSALSLSPFLPRLPPVRFDSRCAVVDPGRSSRLGTACCASWPLLVHPSPVPTSPRRPGICVASCSPSKDLLAY